MNELRRLIKTLIAKKVISCLEKDLDLFVDEIVKEQMKGVPEVDKGVRHEVTIKLCVLTCMVVCQITKLIEQPHQSLSLFKEE